MFEPVYSSQGGAPLGYRCRVLVEKDNEHAKRFCGKLCKSYKGVQAHALAVHGMRIQMEMFSDVQEKANEMYEKGAKHAAAT